MTRSMWHGIIRQQSADSHNTTMNKFFARLFDRRAEPLMMPRIFISVSTNSPVLSKSRPGEFTITLEATVDSSRPITVDAWRNVLDSGHLALDYEGLTFKDCETGEFAPRIVIDVFAIPPSIISADSKYVIEIPPRTGGKSYSVVHKFNGESLADKVPLDDGILRKLEENAESLRKLEENLGKNPGLKSENDGSESRYPESDVDGFKVGHTYEIGLGTKMASVGSWKWGTRTEIFAEKSQQKREEWRHGESVEMVLERTARFEVVE